MANNRQRYEARELVESYEKQDALQRPEARIMEMLGPRLLSMNMLDIGVGAGRTTLHFAHRVRSYRAIDYSSAMIEACRRRFPDLSRQACFSQTDARAMTDFGDGEFDFVLFSFNGIDYVGAEDRGRILKEIRRVTAPGGYFGFSTHNLESDPRRAFVARPGAGYARHLKQWGRRTLFVLLNPHWLVARQRADGLWLNDGADRFRMRTYYIRPSVQVRQLREVGFHQVQLLGPDGQEIRIDDGRRREKPEPWLYYLCRA